MRQASTRGTLTSRSPRHAPYLPAALGLPPQVVSNSLLTGDGIAEAAAALQVAPVYRPETRFRAVSWRFAARSSARLGPSRGAAVAALPVDAVLARIVRSAGSV